MLDLGNQINESVDDTEIEMQSKFQSIQYVYIAMVLLVVENQEKESLFEVNDLEILSDVISSSVQLNKDWMETSAREDVKRRLQKVIDITTSEHIRQKYIMLIELM